MKTIKNVNVRLTDDPLENIKIMATLLDKREQENVFCYVMGLYNGVSKQEVNEEKAGQGGRVKNEIYDLAR